ncbi:extracellular matrix protein FRAS1-like, partial [Protobothrops mucrosquamatus]|uniref:extracellular matrix protein FRAS1-like n=1 Tax=Protobothrops mucrosquamatus TaxID=103944 RepID=UPI0007759C28
EENKVRRPGKCCEECVLSKGSCVHNGTLKYHNDLWNGTDCSFCSCDGGQVACRKAKCAKVDCAKGEELFHLQGKCCPECISRGGSCVYKEYTKDVSHCHPDCLTCNQAFDGCDACRDSTKFLLKGRCVDSCGAGFYPDAGLCV